MTLNFQRIDDPDDPRLAVFGERKDALLRQRSEMIVDSDKVVARMIRGGYRVKGLLVSPRFLKNLQEDRALALPPQTPVFLGQKPVLEQIVGHRLHHGVVALAERPSDHPWEQLGPQIVVLNGVGSAENVGAIARSCHAFGFTGLVADELACTPWCRRAIRVSMGSVFRLKVSHCEDSPTFLHFLRQRGYHIYGTGLGKDSQSCRDFKPKQPFALVLGSEGEGITTACERACDQLLQIPHDPGCDSLNVAVASGVLLYQLGSSPPSPF